LNKKVFAAATLAVFATAAHAQSSVTLYGLIDAGISYVNNSKTAPGHDNLFKYDDGVAQGSRWGLRGTEDLGGGLKALFVWKAALTAATARSARAARCSAVRLMSVCRRTTLAR
jgi:Outer membrane protein (porin)